MLLNEINPFLRFVNLTAYKPINSMFCAVDYHFYYAISDCSVEIKGELLQAKSGSIIIIPPETPYSFKDTNVIKVFSINFDFTQNNNSLTDGIIPIPFENFSNEITVEKIEFEDFEIFNDCIFIENKNTTHIFEMVNMIENEFKYKKHFYQEKASSIFKNVLIEIARIAISSDAFNTQINKVLNYINQNFSENLDNSLLAKMTGYHSYHLNRLMKISTGTTLKQYIIDCRIENAKRYLRESSFRISEIAEMCGYNNFTNFSRDFKNKCSVTPSQYRKKVMHIL